MKKILIELPADLVIAIRTNNALLTKQNKTNRGITDAMVEASHEQTGLALRLTAMFGEAEGPLTDIFVPLTDARRYIK